MPQHKMHSTVPIHNIAHRAQHSKQHSKQLSTAQHSTAHGLVRHGMAWHNTHYTARIMAHALRFRRGNGPVSLLAHMRMSKERRV